MAGRGRGRGSNKGVSFNIEQLGFGRGEQLPKATLQPPALFPTVHQKVHPFQKTEELEYLQKTKERFRIRLKESCYIVVPETEKEVARYSDKYQIQKSWSPFWQRMPCELQTKVKHVKKLVKIDTEKKLIELEKKEISENKTEKNDEDEEEKSNEGDTEIEEIEEDDVEDTDYIHTYFDNGEQMNEEDEDLDDDAIY